MRARLAIAGAIIVAAAGAAVGVLLGTGHGTAWAAGGGAVTAVTGLVAALWWEAAREQKSGQSGLRIRQRIGALGRGGRLTGARGRLPSGQTDISQELNKAGPNSKVIAYDGDPKRPA